MQKLDRSMPPETIYGREIAPVRSCVLQPWIDLINEQSEGCQGLLLHLVKPFKEANLMPQIESRFALGV